MPTGLEPESPLRDKGWKVHGTGGIDDQSSHQSPNEQVAANVLDGTRCALHVAGKGGDRKSRIRADILTLVSRIQYA